MPKFDNFEDWIEERWGSQAGLAKELGVAQNTVSQWLSGKSRIRVPIVKKLRALGYDGPMPDRQLPVTQEDLQALGDEILRQVNYSHGDLKKDIQALGAAVQEILKRLGAPK